MAFEDLLKDSSYPLDNKNYFNLVITDLNISTAYPLQFRWKYEDGSFGPWSVVKTITTSGESFPNVPSTLTVENNTPGYLQITWNGNTSTGAALTNFDRVDVYINGSPFDASKAALSFFSAGTKTIVAPAGSYIVSSYAVSKIGTLSAMSTAVTRTVTANIPAALASATPSTPTVSSVLGAIQVSWDGKQSDGSSQPYGFNAAKVYIGTSAGFTPSALNQVDVLNFANGQNTLNIGVGTIVNSVALTYGVDYYVKIATTNGTDTSTAVSATGNPKQIGKVSSEGIVEVLADKIGTGTLAVGSTITVGSTAGKHVVIAGTGDPLTIYGTGGLAGGAILNFNGTKLSIVGDGTFSGNLAIGSTSTASVFKAEPATGIWLGDQTFASAPFSVAVNGVIKANSGTIGGWTLGSTFLQGTNFEINSSSSTIFVGSAAGQHIRISASGGIATYNGGTQTSGFNLSTSGTLSLSGSVTASSGSIGGWTIGSTTLTGGLTTLNSNGTITTSNLVANGGTIGEWNINANGSLRNSGGTTVLYASLTSGGGSWPYALITERSVSVEKLIQIGTTGLSFQGGTSYIFSAGGIAPGTNNVSGFASGIDLVYNLGFSSARWDTVRAGSFLTTSDQRVKNSIEDTPLGLNFINKLRPVAFKYNLGKNLPIRDENNKIVSTQECPGIRTHHGFIAQEVKLALNEITNNPSTDFAAWKIDDLSDSESQQALDYIEFIAPMTKAIQELSARLDALEG